MVIGMKTSLVIVEVSQKQAYIFASNKLSDNVNNSAVIAYVTSSSYFENAAGDCYTEENEVYCGGGHAVLQFSNQAEAKKFIKKITYDAKIRFPELELFATIYSDDDKINADSVYKLTQKLEKKKSVRRASFNQGTFGIERVDTNTKDVIIEKINGEVYKKYVPDNFLDERLYPSEYERAMEFSNLGGSKDQSNFIAVVHVDGNAMGKRVESIRKKYGAGDWENYKKMLKKFSTSIDRDFKETFKEMCERVASNIHDGQLGDIKLKKSKQGKEYFPVRRIITEGDDICFVTEGRIGIECARIFIDILSKKKNSADGNCYAAAAGVAIVHNKYPFYMAYNLAEELCSNAKKYIANSTEKFADADASNVNAIDWHIDFGELGDHVEDIRKKYTTKDGDRMELRPYILAAPDDYLKKNKARDYNNFRKIMQAFEKKELTYARGKIKELRNYIREGEKAVKNYLEANLIEGLVLECYQGIYADSDLSLIATGSSQKKELFIEIEDGNKKQRHSILFDAIESMDTFITLD